MTPERLDHFMARANAIYYASHDPFADFTTSPEISQVFGEIIGLWAAVTWEHLGRPRQIRLVEAGPGRGTLMADALRAIGRAAPAFAAAATVHLIETSPRLRAIQASRVANAAFHADLAEVPQGPMILIANEFLDALPIRQFVRRAHGWTERYVAPPEWIEIPFEPGDTACSVPTGRDAAIGDIVEVNEAARAFVSLAASRMVENPGAALLLDYGPANSAAGDSLQALANKHPIHPLSLAGSADLTAHVDFEDLALVACRRGAVVQGPTPQGRFLSALGLFERAEQLSRVRPDRAAALSQGVRRLSAPEEMGQLFKALAIRSPECPPLAGFDMTASDARPSASPRSAETP